MLFKSRLDFELAEELELRLAAIISVPRSEDEDFSKKLFFFRPVNSCGPLSEFNSLMTDSRSYVGNVDWKGKISSKLKTALREAFTLTGLVYSSTTNNSIHLHIHIT